MLLVCRTLTGLYGVVNGHRVGRFLTVPFARDSDILCFLVLRRAIYPCHINRADGIEPLRRAQLPPPVWWGASLACQAPIPSWKWGSISALLYELPLA
jgi:hypothetical protein